MIKRSRRSFLIICAEQNQGTLEENYTQNNTIYWQFVNAVAPLDLSESCFIFHILLMCVNHFIPPAHFSKRRQRHTE